MLSLIFIYPLISISRCSLLHWLVQDMETTIVNGSGTETGQVITTTVGGRDGKPKQVIQLTFLLIAIVFEKSYYL